MPERSHIRTPKPRSSRSCREGSAAAMHESSREGPAAAMLSRIRNHQLLTCMAAARKASCSHAWEQQGGSSHAGQQREGQAAAMHGVSR
eukprot:357102-Chlamydomonas_euryale.AAC.6